MHLLINVTIWYICPYFFKFFFLVKYMSIQSYSIVLSLQKKLYYYYS